MSPMQGSPRSSSNPKSRGLIPAPPTYTNHDELPTTPLPATHSSLDQRETAVLPAQSTPMPPGQLSNPGVTRQLSNPGVTRQLSNPGVTRQLSNPGVTRQLSNPGVTRQLITRQLSSPGTFRPLSQAGLSADGTGEAPRAPVTIKGDMKKHVAPPLSARSHMKRRLLVSGSGVLIFIFVASFALLLASPLGQNLGQKLSAPPQNNGQVAYNGSNNLDLVVQATATASSYQHNDGYDPYSTGGVVVSDGAGSLPWPVGQCTFWANYRYHELTGHWIPWSGNAAQWVAGARAAGWHVSTSPHVPSVIVLMPYVQGAYGYGHVAVVESENDNVSPVVVHTSNMNWFNGGGGWDKESDYDFIVGPGVYFVWK